MGRGVAGNKGSKVVMGRGVPGEGSEVVAGEGVVREEGLRL